jgi:hypothetical protein
MFYNYKNTGLKETWGYGLPGSPDIEILSNTVFALRPGCNLDDVSNSTITITALTAEETVVAKEECGLPADYTPEPKVD